MFPLYVSKASPVFSIISFSTSSGSAPKTSILLIAKIIGTFASLAIFITSKVFINHVPAIRYHLWLILLKL